MEYNLIIIWWWASWLFCTINSPKKYKKLILEKQDKLWTKILLSWWWRCNFSNTQISQEKYFWENKKMLPSIFHKFNNNDMVNFLETNWVETQIEDSWRIILKSWKAQTLLDLLVKKTKENNTEIKLSQNIIEIQKEWEIFIVKTETEEFKCKKLVIATGWISYPQTGTNWYWLNLATQFNLKTIKPYPALCGIETTNNFEILSGSSTIASIELLYNNKSIYHQTWNLLFTHRGLSGPIIFNTSAAIWEYISQKWITNHANFSIKIKLEAKNITKRMYHSNLISQENEIICKIKSIRPLTEAKVSGGWVSINEIKINFESKKISDLYFIWETLDIVWETGWFNLQWAWSSGFVCGQNLQQNIQ